MLPSPGTEEDSKQLCHILDPALFCHQRDEILLCHPVLPQGAKAFFISPRAESRASFTLFSRIEFLGIPASLRMAKMMISMGVASGGTSTEDLSGPATHTAAFMIFISP